jgi:hypothetical protein
MILSALLILSEYEYLMYHHDHLISHHHPHPLLSSLMISIFDDDLIIRNFYSFDASIYYAHLVASFITISSFAYLIHNLENFLYMLSPSYSSHSMSLILLHEFSQAIQSLSEAIYSEN